MNKLFILLIFLLNASFAKDQNLQIESVYIDFSNEKILYLVPTSSITTDHKKVSPPQCNPEELQKVPKGTTLFNTMKENLNNCQVKKEGTFWIDMTDKIQFSSSLFEKIYPSLLENKNDLFKYTNCHWTTTVLNTESYNSEDLYLGLESITQRKSDTYISEGYVEVKDISKASVAIMYTLDPLSGELILSHSASVFPKTNWLFGKNGWAENAFLAEPLEKTTSHYSRPSFNEQAPLLVRFLAHPHQVKLGPNDIVNQEEWENRSQKLREKNNALLKRLSKSYRRTVQRSHPWISYNTLEELDDYINSYPRKEFKTAPIFESVLSNGKVFRSKAIFRESEKSPPKEIPNKSKYGPNYLSIKFKVDTHKEGQLLMNALNSILVLYYIEVRENYYAIYDSFLSGSLKGKSSGISGSVVKEGESLFLKVIANYYPKPWFYTSPVQPALENLIQALIWNNNLSI